jgi:hypothetical protein
MGVSCGSALKGQITVADVSHEDHMRLDFSQGSEWLKKLEPKAPMHRHLRQQVTAASSSHELETNSLSFKQT